MTNEDKDFLEAHRGHYNTAVNAGYIQDLGQDIKMRMVDIIKRYFAPAYLTNLWCGPCIMDMVKYLYTQYDAMPIIKKETFPKHDEPVKLNGLEVDEIFVDEVKAFVEDARGINNSEKTFIEQVTERSELQYNENSEKVADIILSDPKGGNGLIEQISATVNPKDIAHEVKSTGRGRKPKGK